MARMPGAVWRPMPGSSTTRMAAYDVLCFHTMVGSLAGTDAYFRSSASGTNSHFGVGGDGTIYQWVDTTYRSGASLNGNYHLISVETADMGAEFAPWGGSNVPPWTQAQIEANAKIAAWVNAEHGIPLVQIPDALPSRRGVGYHRLGVPGYMVAGAEKWSSVNKKACPGDHRIAQVPDVIASAHQEDDMQADERQALFDIRSWLRGGDPNVDNITLIWLQNQATQNQLVEVLANLIGGMPKGQNNFHWLAAQILTALAAQGSAAVSADAIAAAIPADIAEQVAQKLADRLAS